MARKKRKQSQETQVLTIETEFPDDSDENEYVPFSLLYARPPICTIVIDTMVKRLLHFVGADGGHVYVRQTITMTQISLQRTCGTCTKGFTNG